MALNPLLNLVVTRPPAVGIPKIVEMKFSSLLRFGLLVALAAGAHAQGAATSLTVEYVSAHPELWPKQVITKGPAQVTLRPSGGAPTTVTLPAGQLMKVVAVEGATVQLEYQGAAVTLPASQTDLLAGAASNQVRIAAASRPVAPPPAAAGAAAPGNVPPVAGGPAGPIQNPLGAFLRDGLIGFRGDSVAPQSGAGLVGKRFIALYFATRSDDACRAFTPRLAQFYGTHRRDSEKFEVIFVPTDRSAKEMAYHVREMQMPWLAVDYDQREVIGRLRQQFGGSDVPNLVVVDERGRVVVSSYEGNKFVGAEKAMEQFGHLLDQS